ncbi:MAG: DUF308 domain-containing protein [Bacteroidia bacterium]|nr:DUF308 domain-containing protein [Bacteroidia bacterium]HQV00641.1 DUF308 domain-containing protein [Bacteroidia bacterium]
MSISKGFTLPLIVLGILLLLFGFISVTAPNMSVQTLMTYLAFMLLATGVLSVIVSLLIRKSGKFWWISMLFGFIAIVFSYYIFTHAEVAAHYYTVFIASWAGFMGLALIAASFFQKHLQVILIVNGLMSLGFGLVIYFNPFSGANTLNFMVGFYTILLSIMILYLAYYMVKPKSKPSELNTDNTLKK